MGAGLVTIQEILYTCVYMYVYTYTYIYVYIHMYEYTSSRTHTRFRYVCVFVRVYVIRPDICVRYSVYICEFQHFYNIS